jgi:peptidoglycan/LPS O-acetylase OafA/YrhL
MAILTAKVAATVLVAECSWRFFEGPINNLKDRLTRKPVATGEAVAAKAAG